MLVANQFVVDTIVLVVGNVNCNHANNGETHLVTGGDVNVMQQWCSL